MCDPSAPRPSLTAVLVATLTPLCSSTHAAVCWSSSTFAGQRPDGAEPVGWALIVSSELVKDTALLPPYILDFGQVSTVVPILHASTLIAPVPCARTFLATVFSARGLRASTIGSNAGFNAVPQPSHCAASGVAGVPASSTRRDGWNTAFPPGPDTTRSGRSSPHSPFRP